MLSFAKSECTEWACVMNTATDGKLCGALNKSVTLTLLFLTGSHYTWTKVVTTLHNIIIGNMWIDQVLYIQIHNTEYIHIVLYRAVVLPLPYSKFQ